MTTIRPSTAARGGGASAFAALAGADARLVCVSADAALMAELRAAAPEAFLAAVASPSALAELLLSGECGVLAVDIAELDGAAPSVLRHLAEQFPDVPIIAIGDRHDEAAVAALVSGGEIYRFLHRPVSAARARTFIDGALRRHEELHGGAAPETAGVPGRLSIARAIGVVEAGPSSLPSWTGPRTGAALGVGLIALPLIVAAVLWVMRSPPRPRVAEPPAPIAPIAQPAAAQPEPAAASPSATPPGPPATIAPPQSAPAAAPAAPPAPAASVAPPAPQRPAPRPAAPAPTAAAAPDSPPATAAAAPAAASAKHELLRTDAVAPEYPEGARDVGLEGWVEVRFIVNTAGEPQNVSVTAADPIDVFEAAALEAVRHWRYQPPPGPVETTERIRFRLH